MTARYHIIGKPEVAAKHGVVLATYADTVDEGCRVLIAEGARHFNCDPKFIRLRYYEVGSEA